MGYSSVDDALKRYQNVLEKEHPHITRITVSVFDRLRNGLNVFCDNKINNLVLSSLDECLLEHPLALGQRILVDCKVIDSVQTFVNRDPYFCAVAASWSIKSILCKEVRRQGALFGAVFLYSDQDNYFDREMCEQLEVYLDLFASTLVNDILPIRVLEGAVQTAREVSRLRDEETADHLARMASYARLIARDLADKYKFNDQFIHHIFQFAPLHDVGKIAIPDHVLLKPGRLDETEMEIMRTHVNRGSEMLTSMIDGFGIALGEHTEILVNIVNHHHERIDGRGYPNGSSGNEIPIEARIVTVADVFDALTNERPYKKAWSFDEAFNYLRENAGTAFDYDCVESLVKNRDAARKIHTAFQGRHA